MAIITIIGAGQMGSALAFVAGENGNIVRMVGTPHDKTLIDGFREGAEHPVFGRHFQENTEFYYTEQWQDAVKGSDFIVAGVSSYGIDWFLDEILMKLDAGIPVLSAAKGLTETEDGELISYPVYWERELLKKGIKRDIYALGGPGTADEIAHHDHTMVAVCGTDPAIREKISNSFNNSYFHVSTTSDVMGLEYSVAIKNAFALGVGIAIGYMSVKDEDKSRAHFNTQAAVFYQAAKEMSKLLESIGAEYNSLLIGLGDLYVTVSGARTRKIGILLGEGKTFEEAQEILGGITLESVVVVRRLYSSLKKREARGEVKLSDYPLLVYIVELLDGHKYQDLPWHKFKFDVR